MPRSETWFQPSIRRVGYTELLHRMSLSSASTRYAVTRADLVLIIPCRCGEEGGAEDGAASANLPCGLEHDGDEATLSGEASNPP